MGLSIDGREIGGSSPCYVVAELSANHSGSLDRAKALIRAAKAAGADAAKVQLFSPYKMAAPGAVCPAGPWKGQDLRDLYISAVTPSNWLPALFDEARSAGITLFASVFSPEDVTWLEANVKCPAYKIASPEALCLPLLRHVRATEKPVIVSLGALRDERELERLFDVFPRNYPLAVLHCVSAYPAPPESMNLALIQKIARCYDVVVGLSDHSIGPAAAVAGVALGAKVIEKHLMLEPEAYWTSVVDGMPLEVERPLDASFSLTPSQFTDFVRAIRQTEAMLGEPKFSGPSPYRRAWWYTRDVSAGQTITAQDVALLRPWHEGGDESPVGRVAVRDARAGEPA